MIWLLRVWLDYQLKLHDFEYLQSHLAHSSSCLPSTYPSISALICGQLWDHTAGMTEIFQECCPVVTVTHWGCVCLTVWDIRGMSGVMVERLGGAFDGRPVTLSLTCAQTSHCPRLIVMTHRDSAVLQFALWTQINLIKWHAVTLLILFYRVLHVVLWLKMFKLLLFILLVFMLSQYKCHLFSYSVSALAISALSCHANKAL